MPSFCENYGGKLPLLARWRPLRTLPARRGREALPGVYELADEGKRLIYIGQSTRDAPNRIRQHLESSKCMKEHIRFWRYTYSRIPKAEEASEIERYRYKHGDLPRFNRIKPTRRDGQSRYLERTTEQ